MDLQQLSNGAQFGAAAFAIVAGLVRFVGRPVIFAMLNGRYETKVEAVAARAVMKERIDSIERTVREESETTRDSMQQVEERLRADLHIIQNALMK